jgi:hypothetical protein
MTRSQLGRLAGSEAITDLPAHEAKAEYDKGGPAKKSGRSCWRYRVRRDLAGKTSGGFVAVVKDLGVEVRR